ncbi:DUF3078 domain-containing protein [Hymenobacter coccineus]|uniref:DUF3078 domain-containing protein n=1 Tax=Hymenobacter coccineus TaxID=1908235 RepID=A0A1G1THQ0_9BACT|nr:DUF3078 domain-containing protein [Hymenobacter coccineus]OGX90387.1 hypothetical protein BEN49_06890 [Hymenobacter coccineus]
MRKRFTLGLLALGLPVAAQTAPAALPADSIRYWATHLRTSLNANEALISKNWKSGGTSSLGLSMLFNGTARYQRGHHNWNGEADFLYAGQYTQGEEGGYRKTNDRLYLDTKYGYDLTKKWGLFTALNLLSQFAPGYNYADDGSSTLISDFLAPGYLTSSIGAEYHPSERFNLRLAPVAPRVTIVRDPDRFRVPADTTVYGVRPGRSTFWQVGFQALAQIEQPLGPNADLKVRYVLFIDYARPRPVDNSHRLDLTLTAKVNTWLNVSLGGILLYDYNQDQGFQYSQNLSLGLVFDRNRPANRPKE